MATDPSLGGVRGGISKSQVSGGAYVPISQMTPAERKQHRNNQVGLKRRKDVKTSYSRFTRGPEVAPGRSVKDLYDSHAAGTNIEQHMKEKTRNSARWGSKVRYGSSVTPEVAAKLDAALEGRMVRGSRAPIVFHHGALGDNILAGALGAHQTTGGVARVVLSTSAMSTKGQYYGLGTSLGDVINHEVAHAQTKGKNPFRFKSYDGKINQVKSLGEEARADATGVRGAGLYQRNGLILGERDLTARAAQERRMINDGLMPGDKKQWLRTLDNAVAGQRNYRTVHPKVDQAFRAAKDKSYQEATAGQRSQREKLEEIRRRNQKVFDEAARARAQGPRQAPFTAPKGGVPRLSTLGAIPKGVKVGGGVGAGLLLASGAAYGWQEFKHRRANDGKFVSKRMGEVSL